MKERKKTITIAITREQHAKLEKLKIHQRQPIDEVIARLLEIVEAEEDQEDRDFWEMQKEKMAEAWDDKYDKVWENA
jgi:predicted CopG family antitoxin